MKGSPTISGTNNDIPGVPSHDEEVSLTDLFLILKEQRRVLWGVCLVVTVLGILLALLSPTIYRYTTTIEIGTVREDGKSVLLDRPETLLAKIREAYIPHVVNQLSRKERGIAIEIDARIPAGSEVITLESKAPPEMEETVIELHKRVVELVKEDHQGVFDIIKREMNVELDKSRNKLSALQDRHKVLVADLKRLDQTAALLRDQIEQLKALVSDAIDYRKMARSQTGDETRAMTLLMIDNEIQQNNQRLAALEERLHIDIPKQRDSLNTLISENSREQQEQAAEVAKIQAAVNNMRETRMLMAPMRSVDPIGVGKATIVLVSAIAGLLLGILAAFATAAIVRIKRDLRTRGQL